MLLSLPVSKTNQLFSCFVEFVEGSSVETHNNHGTTSDRRHPEVDLGVGQPGCFTGTKVTKPTIIIGGIQKSSCNTRANHWPTTSGNTTQTSQSQEDTTRRGCCCSYANTTASPTEALVSSEFSAIRGQTKRDRCAPRVSSDATSASVISS